MGSELRALRDDRAVHVADAPSVFPEQRADTAQQQHAVRALIGGVFIRKMLPDVPERGGAEQGVHQRMREHVGVGVPEQALLPGDVDPAEDQPAALDQPVHVIPIPDSHGSLLSR